ncbi:MAG: PilZ domain-containing protein [Desulfobulbaceae bacterium]|nr:PilZ domain-containing protein [Desulfobulbaceae bacterium]
MKDILTGDEDAIRKEMDFLIEHKMELICSRRTPGSGAKLVVVGKTSNEKSGAILVVRHESEPTCSSGICTFYYHSKGDLLRSFQCKRLKKAGDFVGFEFPKQIVDNQRRKSERMATPGKSGAIFSCQSQQEALRGTVEDISLQGAKILADIPLQLAVGSTLANITLTLCYRMSEIQTIIVIPEAEIGWAKCEDGATSALGIKFVLAEKYMDALINYMDLRSIEESFKR